MQTANELLRVYRSRVGVPTLAVSATGPRTSHATSAASPLHADGHAAAFSGQAGPHAPRAPPPSAGSSCFSEPRRFIPSPEVDRQGSGSPNPAASNESDDEDYVYKYVGPLDDEEDYDAAELDEFGYSCFQ